MANATLILSGGGVKGFIYCGVLKAYEHLLHVNKNTLSRNYFNQVISISVGSIFALLWIIGYDYTQLKGVSLNLQLEDFNEFNFELLFTKYGLNTGIILINQIKDLIHSKNINTEITLINFFKTFHVDYTVLTTNLHDQELNIISYKNFPNLKVIDAIRMAISIPFLFTVKKFNNNIHVDAALISNFPLDFILDSGVINNNSHVIGINITCLKKDVIEINDISSYLKSIMLIIRSKNKINFSRNKNICTISCNLTDELIYGNFNITPVQINKYIDLGYNEFLEYLKNNNFVC